jgi:hypothetical protein
MANWKNPEKCSIAGTQMLFGTDPYSCISRGEALERNSQTSSLLLAAAKLGGLDARLTATRPTSEIDVTHLGNNDILFSNRNISPRVSIRTLSATIFACTSSRSAPEVRAAANAPADAESGPGGFPGIAGL